MTEPLSNEQQRAKERADKIVADEEIRQDWMAWISLSPHQQMEQEGDYLPTDSGEGPKGAY